MIRFRKNDELFGATATPARGDRDAVLFINGMPELTGVEELRWNWRIHVREEF